MRDTRNRASKSRPGGLSAHQLEIEVEMAPKRYVFRYRSCARVVYASCFKSTTWPLCRRLQRISCTYRLPPADSTLTHGLKRQSNPCPQQRSCHLLGFKVLSERA